MTRSILVARCASRLPATPAQHLTASRETTTRREPSWPRKVKTTMADGRVRIPHDARPFKPLGYHGGLDFDVNFGHREWLKGLRKAYLGCKRLGMNWHKAVVWVWRARP